MWCEVYFTTADSTSTMALTLQPFLEAGAFISFQVFQCCASQVTVFVTEFFMRLELIVPSTFFKNDFSKP